MEYPMTLQPDVYMPSREYLALEKQAVYKSEYIAGTIVAMSGASRKHSLNLARQYLAVCAARRTSDTAIRRGIARDSVTSSAADSRRSAI